MPNNKFIIYKATGGLFHMLNSLCNIFEFSKINGYTLIIDTKMHHAFKHSFSTFFDLNIEGLEWYDNYDKVPKNLTYDNRSITELEKNYVSFNDGYYLYDKKISYINLKNYYDDNILVYASYDICDTIYYGNLTVNNEIYNNLINEKHIEKNYISIHFRNTDIKNNIDDYIKKIKECIELTNIKTVYLASDYYEMFDIIKNNINIEIVRYTIPPININNLHYRWTCNISEKYNRIYDSIRDIYFILKSQVFIPSYNSGFSKEIIKMINSKKYIIPNIESNTIIY